MLAAASCQLLSFLASAALSKVDVRAYEDDAEGVMPEDDKPVRITAIVLRPRIVVAPRDRRGPGAAPRRQGPRQLLRRQLPDAATSASSPSITEAGD